MSTENLILNFACCALFVIIYECLKSSIKLLSILIKEYIKHNMAQQNVDESYEQLVHILTDMYLSSKIDYVIVNYKLYRILVYDEAFALECSKMYGTKIVVAEQKQSYKIIWRK